MSKIYRFCCSCVRVSLIDRETGCYFCGGKFVLSSLKDDLKLIKRKKKVAKTY